MECASLTELKINIDCVKWALSTAHMKCLISYSMSSVFHLPKSYQTNGKHNHIENVCRNFKMNYGKHLDVSLRMKTLIQVIEQICWDCFWVIIKKSIRNAVVDTSSALISKGTFHSYLIVVMWWLSLYTLAKLWNWLRKKLRTMLESDSRTSCIHFDGWNIEDVLGNANGGRTRTQTRRYFWSNRSFFAFKIYNFLRYQFQMSA